MPWRPPYSLAGAAAAGGSRAGRSAGGGASAWGSALGGVVNIITKPAGTAARPAGNLQASYG